MNKDQVKEAMIPRKLTEGGGARHGKAAAPARAPLPGRGAATGNPNLDSCLSPPGARHPGVTTPRPAQS